jgi:hypothetical protein
VSSVGVFLPANQSETSCGDKSSIRASSERLPYFSSAQALSSAISVSDSLGGIGLYTNSIEFLLQVYALGVILTTWEIDHQHMPFLPVWMTVTYRAGAAVKKRFGGLV